MNHSTPMSLTVQKSLVGIVLVNWNGFADTAECLHSLHNSSYSTNQVVCIVDNASTDGSVQMLRRWLLEQGYREESCTPGPKCSRVIESATFYCDGRVVIILQACDNYGFAAGNNIGCDFLSARYQISHFWILNNDTLVSNDALELMVQRLDRDPRAGMCGCTLIHVAPKGHVQAYGGVAYSFTTGRGLHIGAGDVYSDPVSNSEVESQLTYVSGASMLVSASFLREIGPMCEDYFLYNEELDWAWRARGRFTLVVETKAVVYHKEGASIGTETIARPPSLLSDFFQARNKIIFTTRYLPWAVPSVWAFILMRAVKRFIAGYKENAWVILKVLFGQRKPASRWFLRSN